MDPMENEQDAQTFQQAANPNQPIPQPSDQPSPGVDVRVGGSTAPPYLYRAIGNESGINPGQNPGQPEHRMTIQNGPWTETVVFQNGKAVRTEYPKGPNGQDILPPWKVEQQQVDAGFAKIASDLGLQPDQMQSASALAQLMTPPPLLTGNPRIDSIAMRQYRRDLGASSQRALAEVWKEGRMKAQNEAIMQRQKFEQEQINAREKQRIDVKAQNRFKTEYTKAFNEIQKEVNELREGKTLQQLTELEKSRSAEPWLFQREAHVAEARSRALAATMEAYPEWGQLAQPAQPAEQPTPQAAPSIDKPPQATMPEGFSADGTGPKNRSAIEALKQIQVAASNANDRDAQSAANALQAAISAYGHINRVPESERPRLLALYEKVQKYRSAVQPVQYGGDAKGYQK